jgi:hypothetical protein
MEEFVQNGLKIFKKFRRSQQSTTWPTVIVATVYVFLKLDQLSTPQKKIQRLSTVGQLSKKILQQSIYRQSRLSHTHTHTPSIKVKPLSR